MRLSLLAVVVAVGLLVWGPNVSAAEGFPLPKDAAAQQDGTSKSKTLARIRTYAVPRGRDLVVAEVRKALVADSWTIVKDAPSPSGNTVRLILRKDGRTWKASFTGDNSRTVIIVTAPA